MDENAEILICVDGSQYGQVVTKYAIWISKKTGRKVTALYVSELINYDLPTFGDFGGVLGTQNYSGVAEQLREIENKKATVIADFVKKSFEDAGIGDRIRCVHRIGDLLDVIQEVCEENKNIKNIIIGKRGENCNFAKGFLGSNLERIIRTTDLPCFVVNREFINQERLLFAYDGGVSAEKALVFLEENKKFFDQEIHLVSVAKPGREEEISKRLTEIEKQLSGGNYRLKVQMLSGVPAEAIQTYAKTNAITCILMGAYGHSKIREFIIGSTTTEVVRRCLVPFLLFH
ncbi:MAG: universal stress protein [Opitutales bacterium]|nr:universal stress protein [Opitutales bacterium]